MSESTIGGEVVDIGRLADGTIRVHISIDKEQREEAIELLSEKNCIVAMQPLKMGINKALGVNGMAIMGVVQRLKLSTKQNAKLVIDLTIDNEDDERDALKRLDQATCGIGRLNTHIQEYGSAATVLKLSMFFRTEAVWRAIGTDAEYQQWCRGRPCIVCRTPPPSEPMHVRRAGDSGTGYKGPYATVPGCKKHHSEQHQHGESVIASQDQYDRWRIKSVQDWCWDRLKERLGYNSFKYVPPDVLRSWAKYYEVEEFLPEEYR